MGDLHRWEQNKGWGKAKGNEFKRKTERKRSLQNLSCNKKLKVSSICEPDYAFSCVTFLGVSLCDLVVTAFQERYPNNSVFNEVYGKNLTTSSKAELNPSMAPQETSLYSLFEGTPWSPSLPASSGLDCSLNYRPGTTGKLKWSSYDSVIINTTGQFF